MTTPRKTTRATIVTAVTLVLLAVAACSGSSGLVIEDPDTTAVSTPQSTSSSVSTTVSPAPPTTSSTPASSMTTPPTMPITSTTDSTGIVESTTASTSSPSISAAEAADRAAAEKTWLDYQSLANELWKQPEGTWKAALQKYAINPALTAQLDGLKAFVAAGKDNWGEVIHHPYWLNPIDGGSTADLMDCIDASNAGSKDAKTGKKLSVGVAHQNTYITLLRYGSEWKVVKVTYLPNLACPGAPTANEEKASMEAARSSSASMAKETQ